MSGLNDAQLTSYYYFMRTKAGEYLSFNKSKAVFADTVTFYSDEDKVLTYLETPDVDYIRNVYVKVDEKKNDLVGKTLTFQDCINNNLRINRYTPNSIEFSYKAAQDAFVLFNDVYYPGWRVYSTQTKKKIEVVRANHTFRGMFLPAGSDIIVMEFRPLSYEIGKWISLFSAVSIILTVAIRHRYA